MCDLVLIEGITQCFSVKRHVFLIGNFQNAIFSRVGKKLLHAAFKARRCLRKNICIVDVHDEVLFFNTIVGNMSIFIENDCQYSLGGNDFKSKKVFSSHDQLALAKHNIS